MNLKPSRKLFWPVLASLVLLSSLLLSACTPGRAAETVPPTSTGPAVPQASPTPGGSAPVLLSPTPQNGMPATPQAVNNTDPNCTYSTYYWQSNPNLWLTDNIVIGEFVYTKTDAMNLLSSPADDSTSMVLKEFFAAALNILKGADPRDIEADMASASEWLNAHPPGYEISTTENNLGQELAVKIAAFNSGILGPGSCKDEPATPTPTPTLTPTITPTPTRTPILPTETPRATATERIQFEPQPTSPSNPEPGPTDQPVEPPTQPPPTKEPQPTSAPTEAPPPPEPPPPEPPPPEEPPPPDSGPEEPPPDPAPAPPPEGTP